MVTTELPHLFFRWIHVLAGVLALGLIWSLVLSQRVRSLHTLDPGLGAFALEAHKWLTRAAGVTWITGFALLGIVYYGGGALTFPGQSPGLATAAGLAALPLAYLVYELVWTVLARHRQAATLVSLVLFTVTAAALERIMTGRAVFIHLGAMLGTIVVANVSARIWPVERRRLASDARRPPSAKVIAMAAVRMRHNAALAVAIVLFMVSSHFPLLYGQSWGWLSAPVVVAVGWLVSWPASRDMPFGAVVQRAS
jgi:uncharacterized membrane protein